MFNKDQTIAIVAALLVMNVEIPEAAGTNKATAPQIPRTALIKIVLDCHGFFVFILFPFLIVI
jgi:hypothetical protein